MVKLDVRLFGLMLGGAWGVSVLGLGIVVMLMRRGDRLVKFFSTVYIGYRATLSGCLIGAVWGFCDGAVSGILIAWIYNKVLF